MTTPIYQLPLLLKGEPIRNTVTKWAALVARIESALAAKGIPAPGATDLLTLAGRVTPLEGYVTARAIKADGTGGTSQAVATGAGTPTALSFVSATSNPAGGWSATTPTRLVAVNAGEYDIVVNLPWPANSTGYRGATYRINGGAWVYVDTRPNASANYGANQLVTIPGVILAAGQYIEVGAWQDSGTQLSMTTGLARGGLRRIA